MSDPSEAIEKELHQILDEFQGKLPEVDVTKIREFIDAREWGVGFDILCEQLFEYEIEVPKEVFKRIGGVGRFMQIDAKTWEILSPLVKN